MTSRSYGLIVAALMVVAGVFSLVGLVVVPEDARIAIHYSGGQADRFVGKGQALAMIPAVMVVVALVGLVDMVARRRKGDTAPLGPAMVVVGLTVLVLMQLFLVVNAAAAESAGIGTFAGVLSGLAFVAIGLVLPRITHDRIAGARTARSLTDPGSWARVNRRAGQVFVVAGVVIVIASVLFGSIVMTVTIVSGVVVILVVTLLARGSDTTGNGEDHRGSASGDEEEHR